jgi:hypothetical protein
MSSAAAKIRRLKHNKTLLGSRESSNGIRVEQTVTLCVMESLIKLQLSPDVRLNLDADI